MRAEAGRRRRARAAAAGRVEETTAAGQGGGRGLARVWREREERGAARVRDGQKARLPPLERLPFIRPDAK